MQIPTSALRLKAEQRRARPRMSVEDEFYCRPRRRRLTIEKCLDDYMNANAFVRQRSACWRCPQGCHNRRTFAASA